MRKIRLLIARFLGPQLDRWQYDLPANKRGEHFAWRLSSAGNYEYRQLSAEQMSHYFDLADW